MVAHDLRGSGWFWAFGLNSDHSAVVRVSMIAFWARVDAPASKTMRPADRVLMARSSTEGGVAAQYPGVAKREGRCTVV